MRYLLLYWCIGCLLVGLGLGANLGECPNDEHPATSQHLIAAAMWPMFITAAMSLPRGTQLTRKCASARTSAESGQ